MVTTSKTQGNIILVKVDWDRTSLSQPADRNFYTLHVDPTITHPFGQKGLALANTWKQLAGPNADGMLILDGDVAIDPSDHLEMLKAIHSNWEIVHTAPAKLWPVSTKKQGWTWGHWVTEPSQTIEDNPLWFSFNYTYLPKALIEGAIKAGLKTWTYPAVDKTMSETARKLGIKVNVVHDCHPKHMNY